MMIITRRVKAFSTHLAVSAVVFFAVLYFIVLPWYPRPHFTVNGGWQGVRIMLFVYFFIGPFLTLVLFQPTKSVRALVFDMVCLAIMQIGVLIGGAYTLHAQRPVGLSLFEGVVYPISLNDLAPQEKTPLDLKLLDDGNPPVVYAHEAVTADEQAGVTLFDFMEGIPEAKLFFLFEPLKNNVDKIFAASLEKNSHASGKFTQARAEYLEKNGFTVDELAFVPFQGRYGSALLIFNRGGRIIDAIPDPRNGN